MKNVLALLLAIILSSCSTLGFVQYEGVWITKERREEIIAYQHKVFDLGEYDQDMTMSVKNPRCDD